MLMIDKQRKKAFKAALKWLLGSTILATASVASLFAYGLWQNRPPELIAVRVLRVNLGTIEETIQEGGTLELGDQQTIKSPDDGAVDRVWVAVGDRLRTSQRLISLRNPEQLTSLDKKQLEIEANQVTVESNREKVVASEKMLALVKQELADQIHDRDQAKRDRTARWELDIQKQELILARSRQKVTETQEKLTAVQQELKSLEELATKGFIPAQEVKQTQERVRVIESELRQAKSDVTTLTAELRRTQLGPVDSLPSVNSNQQVLNAESALRQAQLDFSKASHDLLLKQIEYREAKQKLQNYAIAAPINGKVLSIKVKAGDGIKRGDDLLTVGDPAQEVVKLQLSTLNAAKVRLNQEARVSIIGPNAKPLAGRVQRLSVVASAEGNASQNSRSNNQGSQAAVPAIVQLDKPTGTLIPGSAVSVEIVLKQRQKVVVLGTEVIDRSESKPFVWIEDAEGKAQKRPVTLGLEGLTQVEITSGLRPGDKVLQPPPDSPLQPGTPVKVKEELKTKTSK
ncbi:MAG: hypothetical protein RLZZ338_818 [Cyanobacteriota bacterium]|jgi:HlyD family secretion protein